MFDLAVLLLFAPFIGSFLGVLVTRLPAGRPVILGRSACESCGKALSPLELVPLLSWLVQRGRCRGCGAAIGLFAPTMELAAMAVALAAWCAGGGSAAVWVHAALGWWLLALAWIDALHMRLPNALTLPLIVAGLVVTWWLKPAAIVDHALGAILGFVLFRLVAWGYRRLRGREGLGGGDARLLAAGGAWLGAEPLAPTIFLAAAAGLVWALALRLRGVPMTARTQLPFGPFLALAIWLLALMAVLAPD